MAELYSTIKGMPWEEAIAHTSTVQKALERRARPMEAKAKALLAEHRHDGHAEIEYVKGTIDRSIILSDKRGLGAAMSMEFGRKDKDGKGGMAGLFILHRATGLGGGS